MDFNIRKQVLVVALVVIGMISAVGISIAQEEAKQQSVMPLSVAVIDLEIIYRDGEASRDARRQLKVYQKKIQNDIKKENNALRKAEQSLNRKRSILPPEKFAQERDKFEKNIVAVQRKVQNLQRKFNQAQADASQMTAVALEKVVKTIVQERGYDLILDANQTIFSSTKMNITQETLKRLNEQLPRIKVVLRPVSKER